MAVAARELVHARELEVAFVDVVIEHHGRHVEDAVLGGAVSVEEVIAHTGLQRMGEEVSHLRIGAPVIEAAVYLLPLGAAPVHPIPLGSSVPAVVEHAPFHSHAAVIGALAFALHIQSAADAEEHVAAFEHVAVALCGGHLAPGHECDAACVEQRGDVPVIGEGLGGGVHTGPCAVP